MFYTYSWLLTLVLNHKSYGTFMFIYNYFLIGAWMKRKSQIADNGAFNLQLLEITFVYQFYSRKTTLVVAKFWKTVGLFAFMSFHNHFKLFWYCVLLKMRGIFCPYLFWGTANDIWTDYIQSFVRYHFTCHLGRKYS